ncbi:SDR family NAD(P)-dependent oxidoreductase [Actinokineospora soli]|uniref:SDR family NAD(P)-dependent oxidoreductase n=1 Tax=Actinokineospora soli TaxID=1048753 RepID=A0ABW2TKC0_9PSEU
MAHLMHVDAPSGATYHLTHNGRQPNTDVYNALAAAMGAPRIAATLPVTLPTLRPGPALGAALAEAGVPAEVIPHLDMPAVIDSTRTVTALAGAVTLPPLSAYADRLVKYWSQHLDPDRASRGLRGRRVVVTGASSGIGKATALLLGARGAHVLLVARRADELAAVADTITAAGGSASAHPCDLTDTDAVDALVKDLGSVDMLVNNAGRSIRRSVHLSVDRLHDYERTMALNYFAPLRLTLGLLPGMRARGFGRIVNVTTMGLQSDTPASPPTWPPRAPWNTSAAPRPRTPGRRRHLLLRPHAPGPHPDDQGNGRVPGRPRVLPGHRRPHGGGGAGGHGGGRPTPGGPRPGTPARPRPDGPPPGPQPRPPPQPRVRPGSPHPRRTPSRRLRKRRGPPAVAQAPPSRAVIGYPPAG